MTLRGDGAVLLVEDNPDDVVLALQAFRRNGIPNPLVALPSAEEAWNYLTAAALPELILLDMNLPGASGKEFLRELRRHERTRAVPTIVLTTSKEPVDVLDSYRLGANSYIVKPVDFHAFTEVVELIARYWLSLNQSPRCAQDVGGDPAERSGNEQS